MIQPTFIKHFCSYNTQPQLSSIVSPHGIPIPKGLYFTPVLSLSFFFSSFFLFFVDFRRLIFDVTERISTTKLGHIFTYDCYLKNVANFWKILEKFGKCGKFDPNSPGIYSHGLGAKTLFGGPTLNFDQTYPCDETRYQQSERNLSIYRDSPTCPQIWSTLAQKRLKTAGEFFAHHLNFRIGRHC